MMRLAGAAESSAVIPGTFSNTVSKQTAVLCFGGVISYRHFDRYEFVANCR